MQQTKIEVVVDAFQSNLVEREIRACRQFVYILIERLITKGIK
jgi:hypothetical protein